jgi:hypothetical protein
MDSSGLQNKIKRITIDLDTTEFAALSHCMITLLNYGFGKEINIKKSPSKRGYHITAWSDDGVSLDALIKIRREAGDDSIRCDLDERSGRQIQVLFDYKRKKYESKVG